MTTGYGYLLLGIQAQSARVIEVYLPAHGDHMLIMCDVTFNLKGSGVASFFGTCDTIMIVSHQFDVEHLFSHGGSHAFFRLACLGQDCPQPFSNSRTRTSIDNFPIGQRYTIDSFILAPSMG